MSNPIRILHIVHIMNRGGMESRIMDLYRHINHEKYQFDFYVESCQHGAFEEEIRSMGGRIFYPSKKGRCGFPNASAFNHFLRHHNEYKIIYAYNQWSGIYLKQALECGVPYRIAYARTSIQTRSIKNTIKNIVKKSANKYAVYKFAVSKKAGIWLFGLDSVQKGETKVWPNAIDTEKYKFSMNERNCIRKEIGLKNELTLVHVGNIRFEKNHPFLLDTFAEIKKKYADCKLILVGGGDYKTLSDKIRQLGLENSIYYLGVRDDVPRILQAGDIFIFPSLYEGFPGAVLEAEASGLWCLVSDSITEEVSLTDHIIRLPLSKGPEYWADTLKTYELCDREHSWEEIRDAGYDIWRLAEETELFFDSLKV